MNSLVYRHASQILTIAGDAQARRGAAQSELNVLRDAAMIVLEGQIAWLGPDAELLSAIKALRATRSVPAELPEVDCAQHVLMPGLVDPHTHVVWGGSRRDELELRLRGADYEEIFAAGGGILSSVAQTRDASEEDLYRETLRRAKRMRRAGTTALEIKSGYGLDLETELRQLRVARRLGQEGFRVRTTCLAAHAIPAEFRGSEALREQFVAQVCGEILPQVAASGLADDCDVFCDRGAFTAAEARRILAAARKLGLGIRVHANEFGHTGGAEVAAEFSATSADHLLHLDDGERQALAKAGVIATLLPGTSLILGKPFADGPALVQAGVPIAVATDCNPGSCPMESLALALALACHGCRLLPAQAVVAATHNAAVALHMQEKVGRLMPGMDADVLRLDTDDYRDLVYHAGSPLANGVWIRGEQVDGYVG